MIDRPRIIRCPAARREARDHGVEAFAADPIALDRVRVLQVHRAERSVGDHAAGAAHAHDGRPLLHQGTERRAPDRAGRARKENPASWRDHP